MTITVTPEELRAHQTALEKRATAFAVDAVEILQRAAFDNFGVLRRVERTEFDRQMAEKLKVNPWPKLIPDV